MSLIELRHEQEPTPRHYHDDIVGALLHEGVAHFPIPITTEEMSDGEMMADSVTAAIADPRLAGKEISIGLSRELSDVGTFIVHLAVSKP